LESLTLHHQFLQAKTKSKLVEVSDAKIIASIFDKTKHELAKERL